MSKRKHSARRRWPVTTVCTDGLLGEHGEGGHREYDPRCITCWEHNGRMRAHRRNDPENLGALREGSVSLDLVQLNKGKGDSYVVVDVTRHRGKRIIHGVETLRKSETLIKVAVFKVSGCVGPKTRRCFSRVSVCNFAASKKWPWCSRAAPKRA